MRSHVPFRPDAHTGRRRLRRPGGRYRLRQRARHRPQLHRRLLLDSRWLRGYDWTNLFVYSHNEAVAQGFGPGYGNGYLTGITSGSFAAFNGFGDAGAITLNVAAGTALVSTLSGSFTSAFNDGNVLTVTGFRSGSVVGTSSLALNTSGPFSLGVSFAGGADTVVFASTAGQIVMDDLSVNAIPGVPGPAAALPFALMALRRRKRA